MIGMMIARFDIFTDFQNSGMEMRFVSDCHHRESAAEFNSVAKLLHVIRECPVMIRRYHLIPSAIPIESTSRNDVSVRYHKRLAKQYHIRGITISMDPEDTARHLLRQRVYRAPETRYADRTMVKSNYEKVNLVFS